MSEKIPVDRPSSYMDYLPAIYRQGEVDGKANLLGRFLKIFEKLLSGINDDGYLEVQTPEGTIQRREVTGIEQVLDRIHDYFDPLFTTYPTEEEPELSDFVFYLAKWVALSLDDWEPDAKRRLLKRIVPLYKRRGTKDGLTEYLRIFVGNNVSIDEFQQGIVIGETGKVGVDTFIGGLPPYFFIVTITFSNIIRFGFVRETVNPTKSILDLEKPAHTDYKLRFQFPGIIVGKPLYAEVGKSTIIGSTFPVFV